MHTLILASNLQQASFIKKGIQYENLGATVMPIDTRGPLLLNSLNDVDGVFVISEKSPPAIKAVDNCRFINPLLPIIILASVSNDAYESLVVSKKAVCCFIRPFPFRQITAEMKYAIFCHKEKIEIGKYVFRDLEMDVMNHSVKINNMPVYLRNKEFSLLHYLMANKGRVVTRTDILHHVWDRNTNIMTNTVDVHVSILRKKLESVVNERYIRTVPCLGYMLE